ncbi:MAG: GFA family protein [Salaquimonas sp.]|nr:GFA family protein [Salaquimonas sp.]
MFEGGCSCGAVRYRLKREPMFTHCCHCLDCQKETGSAFAINALTEADEVELLTGKPVAYSMQTTSGRPHDIFRCAKCGVALWSDYGRRGYLLFLRVATLDEPHAIEPDVHIYTRSKVPWVGLPGDVPVVAEYYDMNQLWPRTSIERRKAASDKAKNAG